MISRRKNDFQTKNDFPSREKMICGSLVFYIFISIVTIILTAYYAINSPDIDRGGKTIHHSHRMTWFAFGLSVHILFVIITGFIVYRLCQIEKYDIAWLIVLISIFTPVITFLIVSFIIARALNVELFSVKK